MEKKRGWKFNIIDLLAVIVIIAAAVFLGFKIIGGEKKNDTQNVHMGGLKYVVEVKGLQKDMYDNIEKMIPCQMAASGKWVDDSYIEAISCEPCTVEYQEAYSPINYHLTRWVKAGEDEEYVNAFFYCTAEVDYSDLLNMVGTQEIRIGRSHYVKSVDFELVGTVISVEKTEG